MSDVAKISESNVGDAEALEWPIWMSIEASSIADVDGDARFTTSEFHNYV
jgi:hypothetical protein